jgi:hypothetical protein
MSPGIHVPGWFVVVRMAIMAGAVALIWLS